MNIGQRIDLIKKVAQGLSSINNWAELDFVLGQFGQPTANNWGSGDLYSYSLSMLSSTPDDTLIQMRDYLFPTEASIPTPPDEYASHWRPAFFRVFLSHSSVDKYRVSEVKRELLPFGIDCFVAHQDIEPAKEWVNEIETALATCDAIVAFLSPDFHTSKWCDQEVGYALSRKVVIVPVMMGVDPYGFMARYQGVKADGLPAEYLADRVYVVLKSNPKSGEKVQGAYETNHDAIVVEQFTNAASFESARRSFKRLRSVQRWTWDMLTSIDEAAKSNTQIARANGLPKMVDDLLTKRREVVLKTDDIPF